MKTNDVIDVVDKLGFPAAICVILLVALVYTVRWFIKEVKEARVEHKKERDEWRESSDKNHEKIVQAWERVEEAIRQSRN